MSAVIDDSAVLANVSAESNVEQAGNGCVSVFWATGVIPAFWTLGTVD